MFYLNCLNSMPSRESFGGFELSGDILGDAINENLELSYNEGSILASDKTASFDVVTDSTGKSWTSLRSCGTTEVFDWGTDLDSNEPLVWVHTDSVAIPLGIEVTLSLIHVDEGYLVCLKRGAIQVDVNGVLSTLVRGTSIRSDAKFSFQAFGECLPDNDDVQSSLYTCTMKATLREVKAKVGSRKNVYTTYTASCVPVKEACFYLDGRKAPAETEEPLESGYVRRGRPDLKRGNVEPPSEVEEESISLAKKRHPSNYGNRGTVTEYAEYAEGAKSFFDWVTKNEL